MFKKLLLVILLLSASLYAQTVPHSSTLNWIASPTVGVTYNVYRANNPGATLATCPPADITNTAVWIKVSTGIAGLTFKDTSVSAGQSLCYFVTAVLATSTPTTLAGESVPSVMATSLIPRDTVQPPTGLSIPTVAMTTSGSTTFAEVNWTAPLGDAVSWTLYDDKATLLASGYGVSSGNMSWGGHREKMLSFKVCDSLSCVSRTFTN
jgi:hypothetical protein